MKIGPAVGPAGARWVSVRQCALTALPIVALLAFWEIFARSGAVTLFVLPPVSIVLARILEDAKSGELWIGLWVTVWRSVAGFAMGAVAGLAIGIAMARNRASNWFFDPLISVGFPMPKVAFLPVVILWLGVFDSAKIMMVTIEVLFPVATATLAGLQGVGRELVWSARSMGATHRELLWQVYMPAALPQLFTGVQIALPIALIVEIFTEMAMGGYGLGAGMMTASRYADSVGVFAGIIEIAVLGFMIVRAMSTLRRRFLLWHQEALAPTTV